MRTENIEIIRFERAHYDAFVSLFRRTFSAPISADSVARKYNTDYTGVSHIGFAAFQNDRMIAYYGVIPTLIWIGGKQTLACQSADTMTDPEFKGRGLFPRLAEMTYHLATENNIKLVFGWPNQYSYPVFKNKLNWQEIRHMEDFKIKTRALPVSKILMKLKLQPIYLWLIRKVFPVIGVNAIAWSNSTYSESYLSYKEMNGARRIQIKGTNGIVSMDHRLKIGAIKYQSTEDLRTFIQSLLYFCRFFGIQEIVYSTNIVDESELAQLEDIGFQSSQGLPLMYRFFSAPNEDIYKVRLTILDFDTF